MIKKTLLTLSLAGFYGLTAMAQSTSPCGTDDVYRRLSGLYPEIAERNEALSKEIAAKLSTSDWSKFSKTTDDDGTTVYHVPLVFHVIHDYGTEYVTDASIVKSVADINLMFNKMNADTSKVIPPFKGFINNSSTRYIGNARIQWHLATIDPDGNPTNGITRRRSYLTKSGGDLSKFDQWPSSSYMNIWLINTFSSRTGSSVLAYAYKPATGDVIPYWDGVISKTNGFDQYNTLTHELGHELNLDHTWGGNNDPGMGCGGDDDVDDTPPTEGHPPPGSDGCGRLDYIYDTVCIFKKNQEVGKVRVDSFKRPDGTVILFSSNSTTKGLIFKNRTASTIDAFTFYPSDTIGSTYKIGLSRNNVLTDSITVVSTVKDAAQTVNVNFKMAASDTSVNFKLFFLKNPGALRDTIIATGFKKGVNGSVFLKNSEDYQSDNFYNFFYDIKFSHGYFKLYANDSLVNYPDTVNAQNVMDYTYCSLMFTHGQINRMRAALTSSVGNRDSLISESNLIKTGARNPLPSLKPKAEYSVERGTNGSFQAGELSYFLCADLGTSETPFNFVFRNRTWRAATTGLNWSFSNSATVGSSTSITTVSTKFATSGWATVTLAATNANGTDSFIAMPSVYVADPATKNPIGYYQDFNDATENSKWPIFNYYNNRYKWEITNLGGTYDATSIRYRSFDDRTALKDLVNGDPAGDYDDFFTPAFDLSGLGTHGNLNFMYAGAYATNNFDLMKDVLEISYSTDCGGNWTNLKTMKNAELQTVGSVPTTTREYTPAWNDWKAASIDLKSGATNIRNSRVFFRFRYKPSARTVSGQYQFASGNNFYMDRINISNNPLSVNEMILGEKKATVAPNPTNSNAYVLFSKANANVSIQVLDVTGKTVYATTTKVDQNNARIEIPASYISAKGFYMVHITGDDNLRQTEKLVVY
ncbi:MAG: M43 family zinc metalloprotease [Chitinophagaceae bacterium]|jgi:hypothetical protein